MHRADVEVLRGGLGRLGRCAVVVAAAGEQRGPAAQPGPEEEHERESARAEAPAR